MAKYNLYSEVKVDDHCVKDERIKNERNKNEVNIAEKKKDINLAEKRIGEKIGGKRIGEKCNSKGNGCNGLNGNNVGHYEVKEKENKEGDEYEIVSSIKGPKVILAKKWIEDSSVTECFNCKIGFGWFNRKHHCRLCGRIFCSSCSIHRDTLENNRCCDLCFKNYNELQEISILLETFENALLSIDEFDEISTWSRTMRRMTRNYYKTFSSIPRKLSTESLNRREEKIIISNLNILSGHIYWLIPILHTYFSNRDRDRDNKERNNKERGNEREREKGYNSYFINRDKLSEILSVYDYDRGDKSDRNGNGNGYQKRSCSSELGGINCPKSCELERGKDLGITLSLIRLFFGRDSIVDDFIIEKRLKILDYEEFKSILLHLFYYSHYPSIEGEILRRCSTDKSGELLVEYFYLLNTYENDRVKVNAKTKAKNGQVDEEKRERDRRDRRAQKNRLLRYIDESRLKLINKLDTSISSYVELREFDSNESINLQSPFSLTTDTIVFRQEINVKDSYTRPTMITFRDKETKDIVSKILYKKESIFKDKIVMNILSVFSNILREEEGIDFHILKYNVLITEKNGGIIEIVDKSETLYNIREKLKFSVLYYLIEKNADMKASDIREQFTRSTAAYCILCYLLGIGDRHLDNIMIGNNAHLFHIDYSYLLGNDPKYSIEAIRLSEEIIEAIGGIHSENYKHFQNLSSLVFNCARRHINFFIEMLSILEIIHPEQFSVKTIEDECVKRFEPYEDDQSAKIHIINRIDHSKDSTSYSIYDTIYHINTIYYKRGWWGGK